MTFAAQIVKLKAKGLSNKQIAAKLGCRVDYVRAALSRHRHGGLTPGDRAASKRQYALVKSLCDRATAAEAGRQAYRESRLSGADARSATRSYRNAYSCARWKTARKARGAAV